MLCEKCREREATVHLTFVEPRDELIKHDFCEPCFPSAREELGRVYNETAALGAGHGAHIRSSKKAPEASGGLRTKCKRCGTIVSEKEIKRNLKVCPHCQHHFRIDARERIEALLESGSFEELDSDMMSVDALNMIDRATYKSKLADFQKTTRLKDAVMTGLGKIGRHRAGVGVMDFRFMGGSMGSVVGEKLTRLVEKCTAEALPVVIVSSSGGARVYEGMISLMQMAKTCGALGYHAQARLPFISVLTDPTVAGVLASFASVGGLIIAEPGAMIGFAGPQMIKAVTKAELPKGFQTSEFLLERGLIDAIVSRKEMKKQLIRYLDFMNARQKAATAG